MRSAHIRITALIAVTALSACSGAGTPSSPIPQRVPIVTSTAPASASSQTRATFVVHWPSAAQASAASKRRQTLSASTESISVSVNGGAGAVVNKPTLTGSPSTTSVSIVAQPGTDQFTFNAWDHLNASGNILDQSTVDQTILADANIPVSVVLDGVCAALVPTLAQSGIYVEYQNTSVPLVSGSRTILKSARIIGPASKTFQFTRVDADGNTVLTSGDVSPISVVESGSTPHVTIAPVASGPSNTMFTLTPLGAEPDGYSTTITAAATDCGPGSQIFPNSFQVSTSAAVLVADANAGILAYDQDGTYLAQLASSTSVNYGIRALAYSPKSGGYLVAIEQNPNDEGGSLYFQTLTLSGTVIGSSSFTPHNDDDGAGDTVAASEAPGNLVYDPADGNFYLALQAAQAGTNGENGLVEEYSISGSTATFVNLVGNAFDPYCLTVLANGNLVLGDLYETESDDAYDTFEFSYNLADYNPATDTEATTFATTSLSFDSTRGNILSLTSGGNGTYEANVSYGDNNSSLGTAFAYPPTPYNGGVYYASAYNPGNDELYLFSQNQAAGLSGSTIYQGGSTTSNLPAGAFPNLSSPTEALVLP